MKRKITAISIAILLCCSTIFIATRIQPVRGNDYTWSTVNTDPNFTDANLWGNASWPGRITQENSTIFPIHYVSNDIAYTELDTEQGGIDSYDQQVWDSACVTQSVNVSATDQQRVTLTVNPDYQNLAGTSLFDVYFEVWVNFTSAVGDHQYTLAELMIKLHVNTNNITAPGSSENSTTNSWYFESKNHDIPENTWGTYTYNISQLLERLQNDYDIPDLSNGRVYEIDAGVEGYTLDNGTESGIGASWSNVSYQVGAPRDSRLSVYAENTYDESPLYPAVYIDDNYVGTAPVTVAVTDGYHTIELDQWYGCYYIPWYGTQLIDSNNNTYSNGDPVPVYSDTSVNGLYTLGGK